MSDRLITIRNFAYGADPGSEAEIARIKLEANGIDCTLGGKNFVSMYWIYSGADGGIKLRVRESDAVKALEILTTDNSSDFDHIAEQPETDKPISLTCEKCGSENLDYESFAKIPFYLGILLFSIPLPFAKGKYKCLDCGHTMKKPRRLSSFFITIVTIFALVCLLSIFLLPLINSGGNNHLMSFRYEIDAQKLSEQEQEDLANIVITYLKIYIPDKELDFLHRYDDNGLEVVIFGGRQTMMKLIGEKKSIEKQMASYVKARLQIEGGD